MKRWMLSTDGGVTYDREVTPLRAVKWSWDRKLDEGQIFFRMKLNTPLLFGGEDYRFFRTWHLTSARRCSDLYVRRERLCDGGWSVLWTGLFSTGTGTWDHDTCQWETTPETQDRYTCLLDKLDKAHNVLRVGPETVYLYPAAGYEFMTNYQPGFSGGATARYGCKDPDPFAGDLNWDLAHTQAYGATGLLSLYWREAVRTECIDGVPTAPPGLGWLLQADDCAIDGTALYVRQPSAAWPFGDLVQGTCVGGVEQEPAAPCDDYLLVHECGACPYINGTPGPAFGDTLDWGCWYICLSNATADERFDRARPLEGAMNHMLANSDCGAMVARSDFFEWDPPGDADGYAAGVNYVTGSVNELNALKLLEKSDAKDPGSSEPATREDWTLKDAFLLLRQLFRVYWNIDDDGNLRLEHWHYWTFQTGLDTTAGGNASINRKNNRFQHIAEEIPRYEKITTDGAGGADFIGRAIENLGACVQGEKIMDDQVRICTDIRNLIVHPDDVSNDGFVLLACRNDSIINSVGGITDQLVSNGPVCTANLHRYYHTWDRKVWRLELNGDQVTADGILPNVQQSGVKAEFCCGMEDWQVNEGVITELGQRFLAGRPGYVDRAELDDATDVLTMTLRYAL